MLLTGVWNIGGAGWTINVRIVPHVDPVGETLGDVGTWRVYLHREHLAK